MGAVGDRIAKLTAVPTQLFNSLSQATRVTDAVDGRGTACRGMFTISSGDKASYVEVASTAKADELGRSARSRNSPADGKAVSRGPLVIISRSAQKWRFVLLTIQIVVVRWTHPILNVSLVAAQLGCLISSSQEYIQTPNIIARHQKKRRKCQLYLPGSSPFSTNSLVNRQLHSTRTSSVSAV